MDLQKRIFLLFFLLLMSLSGFSQNQNIFDAIRNNKNTILKKALECDHSLANTVNEKGFTPLILASYHHNLDAARILLNYGADVNALSDMGTALMAATYKKDLEMVTLLIEHGANVNLKDVNGTTALHLACIFNAAPIAKILIKNKANMNSKDQKSKTPLDYAILNNNIEIIKLFDHE